jgi:uncharacterized protein (DUF1697 family)
MAMTRAGNPDPRAGYVMKYVALLRAVNVAGKGMVSMAELRASAERLGLKNVRTILQSGNLLFQASKSAAALERQLEAEILRRFHQDVPVIVRSDDQLGRMIDRNPFAREAVEDPGHLLAVFLKRAPAPAEEKSLRSAIVGRERIKLDGITLYAVYPDGVGQSKLTAALIDKKLGTRGTARNWNTVLKLQAAMAR